MREQMIWNGYEDRLVEKSVKNDEKSEKNGNKISRVLIVNFNCDETKWKT